MDKDSENVYSYILTQEAEYKTLRVPITGSKDWNMHEHVEKCTNVANGWFNKGQNDGNRPYNDIVTPIINVAFRSEGFNVSDIVPFVNNPDEYYKSFLVKKYHPQWARKHELDTFIDDLVETSIIYDLALIKNVNNERPEVVKLQTIAFCDQTDVLAGPICLKHHYSIAELADMSGRWFPNKVDEAITMAKAMKLVPNANDREVKTPGKFIEIYELHGNLPEHWENDSVLPTGKYTGQLHIVTFYTNGQGKKVGITLFKGPEKNLPFRALKIDRIKSHGRACGKSIVETLFEPQMWTNYTGIKIKKMLDSAINVFQTSDSEHANQKLTELKDNTILKHEDGKPITKLDSTIVNLPAFQNHQTQLENNARVLGSASDAQLGTNPVAGTPFALQNLVVQQGQGIHEYRQGKIATFFADVLYRDWILKYLVEDMNKGKTFSEELSLDEMSEIAETIATNWAEGKIKDKILKTGIVTSKQEREMMKADFKEKWLKGGNRKFFNILEGELKSLPIDVFVNIVGKQKNLAQNADKLTNILREVIKSPGAFQQIPGLGKAFNELLESSGLSPIDFTQMTSSPEEAPEQLQTPAVEAGQQEPMK